VLAPLPANRVEVGAVIAASELVDQLGTGVDVAAVLAKMVAVPGLEFWQAPDAAARLAARLGATVRFGDEPVPASTLARTVSAKLAPARPAANVTPAGDTGAGSGTQSYGYVVVARDASGKVARQSAMASTDLGPAPLSAARFNRVTWTTAAGAAGYLVYRVVNGGALAQIGLLTPAPLAAGVTSFDDTGVAAAAGAPQDRDLGPNDLAAALGDAVADGATVDVTLPAAAVVPIAAGFALPVVRTDRVAVPPTIVIEELAFRIGEEPDAVLQRAVAALDRSALTVASTLTLDEAREALSAFGITAVPQRTISVERGVTVTALANQLGLRPSVAVADLALLGITAAPGDLLTPEQAAQLARRHDAAVDETLPVGKQLVGLEENPLKKWTDPPDGTPRAVHDAQLWKVLRRGFQRAILTVTITGVGDLTWGPMLVNRDEGHGIGFTAAVPEGKDLVFSSEGKVTLDGADVTNMAFAWKGACFAGDDDDLLHPRDFVFDGPGADPARRATFAVATPAGALDPAFAFPTAGPALPMPGLSVGKTRFAFFVQEAHWSAAAPPTPSGMPRPHVGFLDGSVFAPASGADGPHAADVVLSWLDHEAYKVRVLIPQRFALVDHDGILAKVRRAVERVRAAGIEVVVDYIDDHWVLGLSAVSGETAEDPILSLRGGSLLNPNPT
jgi:hypothetical protein